MADGQLARIVFRLSYAFGQLLVQRLGFDDAELGIAIFQHVIGGERLAAFAVALEAAGSDGILAPEAAAFDDAPAGRF